MWFSFLGHEIGFFNSEIILQREPHQVHPLSLPNLAATPTNSSAFTTSVLP